MAVDKSFSLGVLTFTAHHKQLCAVRYVHRHIGESGGMLPQEKFALAKHNSNPSQSSADDPGHVLRQQTKSCSCEIFRPDF